MLKSIVPLIILSVFLEACPRSRRTIPEAVNTVSPSANSNLEGEGSELILENVPSNFSSETSLEIQVSGNDLFSYQYKLVSNGETECYNPIGYSPEIPLPTILTLDLSDIEDGPITLCVIGKLSDGTWMEYTDAVAATWVKKTTGPTPVDEFTAEEGDDGLQLNWTAELADTQGYILAISSTPFPEEIFLQDESSYEEGDTIGESIRIAYKGTSPSSLMETLQDRSDYFFAVAIYDEFNFYSIPKILEVKSFNVPFEWLDSGQDEALYAGAPLSGQQVDNAGNDQDLYLCRAFHVGSGLIVGQLVPDVDGNLGSGQCYSVVTINNVLRSIPMTDYEVFVTHRETAVSWKKITVEDEVFPNSIISGYEEPDLDNTVSCRSMANDRFRPGSAYEEIGGCLFSSYNDGAIEFLSDNNNYEILVFDAVMVGE